MNLYTYEGPVKEFGIIINPHWTDSTYAVSEKKARSNMAYHYKKEHGRKPDTKITLSGKITLQKGD